ncbi:hypothetical protein [Streptacidiphilus melanogenes]|uniref:hypothetical protein n=1 Tax=Streptacidiphilus melanogenes TaxID=411235 RepID=UPI0005A6F933|nr:hypothetical protein [Streptacidiphilus melanogenes]
MYASRVLALRKAPFPEKVFGARRQGVGHGFLLEPPLRENEVAAGRTTAFSRSTTPRTHEISAAIEQAGWQAPANGGMSLLWKAIPMVGKGVSCRTGRALEVSDLPTSFYSDVFGTGLTVGVWGQRPALPVWIRPVLTPQSDAIDAVGVRQFRGVDVSQVVETAYRTHSYFLEIQLQSQYFNSAGPVNQTDYASGSQC